MLKLNNINFGDKVAVAVSGGIDSMCLLHLLLQEKQRLNLEIIAVNIDHSIRGKDSENDSLFVKNYCEKLGVLLYYKKVDAPAYAKQEKLSLENAGRVLRYQFFNEVLTKNQGFKLATAHHKSDLFESVLLNVFRGTGLKGLKGIEHLTDKIVRPILNCSKQDVIEYQKIHNVPFTEDLTNLDSTYTRNYIRNNITPIILDKFPNAIDGVYNLSKVVDEENDFIENYAEKLVVLKNGNYTIPTNEHPAVTKRAIILCMKKCGICKDYEKAHVDAVYALTKNEAGSEVTLPNNVTAVKSYNEIIFYTDNPQKPLTIIPYTEGEIALPYNRVIIKKVETANYESGINYFDGNKIPKNAVIRYRQDGDVFTKFGGGAKKLKDYFIDKKIPVRERDFIPLIAYNNEVLVVLGVEISETVKITSDTEYIIKAKMIKE